MTTLTVGIAGIGAWSAACPSWDALRAAFVAGLLPVAKSTTTRPVPILLPPAERRRTPDGVAVAIAVAQAAIDDASRAGPDPTTIATVFASAHGELAIVDYLCETLATAPLLVSPTRFHHSVHNAAAGYWTIATGNHAPSTSIAAGEYSFAVGFVEAMTQVVAEGRPVLLVAFDTPTTGLLSAAVANSALFGAALLLTVPGDDDVARITTTLASRPCTTPRPRAAAFDALAESSPAARSLALLEALATGVESPIDYPTGPASSSSVTVRSARSIDRPIE